jgi:hypothetical protein
MSTFAELLDRAGRCREWRRARTRARFTSSSGRPKGRTRYGDVRAVPEGGDGVPPGCAHGQGGAGGAVQDVGGSEEAEDAE